MVVAPASVGVRAEASAGHQDVLLAQLSSVLFSCKLPAKPHYVIALSGGADSMALALLMQELSAHITTLTIDHGMRKESGREAHQVAQWMRARGIAHHILTPAPDTSIRNTQTRAREMRYRALSEWCREHNADALLLAHHADDQAETVALQKHRGDSPPSRAGMALVAWRDGVRVIRPLLGVRKTQLIAYLESQKQAWVEDPSNASDRYARNRLRKQLDDTQMRALWHEAQAQGEQRHRDDLARNAWVAQHMHAQDNGVRFALPEWRVLVAEMGSDVLSRAIQAVGQNPHRPRLRESLRVACLMREEDAGKATLGGTVIRWGKAEVSITLEPKRLRALEAAQKPSHMSMANPLKLLASEPFWWFNHGPLFD